MTGKDCIGDLFPHRYRPARDDEGFVLGHLMPDDSGQWLTTAHVFKVVKELLKTKARELDDEQKHSANLVVDIAVMEEQLAAKDAEIAALKAEVERMKQEAQIHAQEARTQRATVQEIYQLVTGSNGEPGDWNGAEPVRRELATLREQVERLSAPVDAMEWSMACPSAPDGTKLSGNGIQIANAIILARKEGR